MAIITLNRCPSTLQEGFDKYSPSALKYLTDGKPVSCILPYDVLGSDRDAQAEIQQGSGRLSLSGAQAKFSMILDERPDETGMYHFRFARPEQRGQYILKPAPLSLSIIDRADCPANEHLSMQLASQVYGIETAANALCFFQDGTPAYITRRFDLKSDGSKYAMEDFASMGGYTRANGGSDFKYCNASYEECTDMIRRYVKAAPVEILKFFRILLFDYIISNSDAHLKNFSLIERQPNDYMLSPSYDLLNTFLHLAEPTVFALDKGLFREGWPKGDVHSVNRNTFIEFGQRIGLPPRLVSKEIDRFASDYPLAITLIEHSFLSDASKRLYLQTFNYRRSTLR